MRSARPAGRGFFPLDEELELLPGKLTPREHERLVRLSGWLAFERAAELVEEFLGIAVDKSMAQRYTETAGAIYIGWKGGALHCYQCTFPPSPLQTGRASFLASGFPT
jgi:hypothetical protein